MDIVTIDNEGETVCYKIVNINIIKINLDRNTEQIVYKLDEIDENHQIYTSKNGRYLLVIDRIDITEDYDDIWRYRLIDIEEKRIIREYKLELEDIDYQSIKFVSKGKKDYLICKLKFNELSLLDINENSIIKTIKIPKYDHGQLFLSPNHEYIVGHALTLGVPRKCSNVATHGYSLFMWNFDQWLNDNSEMKKLIKDEFEYDYNGGNFIENDKIIIISANEVSDRLDLKIIDLISGELIAKTDKIDKYYQIVYDRYLYLYNQDELKIYKIGNMSQNSLTLTKLYKNRDLKVKLYHRGSRKFILNNDNTWGFPSNYSQDIKYLSKTIRNIMNCLLMLNKRSDGNCFSLLPIELITNDIYRHLL